MCHFKTTKQLKIVDTSRNRSRMFPELEPVTRDGELDLKERAKASYTAEENEQRVWGDIHSAFSERYLQTIFT